MIRLSPCCRHQLANVAHHALHARADRRAPPSQQIQRRRSETSHDACAIASVAMGVLMELVSRIQCHRSMLHQFLASCTTPSGVVRRLVRWRWLAFEPGFTDVFGCLFGSQRPGGGRNWLDPSRPRQSAECVSLVETDFRFRSPQGLDRSMERCQASGTHSRGCGNPDFQEPTPDPLDHPPLVFRVGAGISSAVATALDPLPHER